MRYGRSRRWGWHEDKEHVRHIRVRVVDGVGVVFVRRLFVEHRSRSGFQFDRAVAFSRQRAVRTPVDLDHGTYRFCPHKRRPTG